ncbi:MAG: hypothetical protein NTZ26_08285 [Candidatus Aminicenantes bacterium]|nr:hypothetical protein [Candidatus Aminicenantes bacterium]
MPKREPTIRCWAAGFFLAASALLLGQSNPVPSFRFLREDPNARLNKNIVQELKRRTIQPTKDQAREILKSLLDTGFDTGLEPWFFLSAAKHLGDAFDKELRAEYNRRLKATLDEDDVKTFGVDETGASNDFYLNESEEDPAASQYAFRCLDFDGDKSIDLVIFNQVFFGPSQGLVFCGRSGGAFSYLFDCSGAIAKIERIGDKLYVRYVVTIIEPSETEILAGIAYDFKTKACSLDSKLYYAQQTRFPKALGRPEPFETSTAVTLRFSPTVDDKENLKNANGYFDYTTTRTLRGNAVAEFPKSAGGFVLARENGWAFVAFGIKVMPAETSLHHGMEPGRFDKAAQKWVPIDSPRQYYCGWIDSRAIVGMK